MAGELDGTKFAGEVIASVKDFLTEEFDPLKVDVARLADQVRSIAVPPLQGEPGRDGKDGEPGRDGKDGDPGRDGKDGAPGIDGKNGETPSTDAVLEVVRHVFQDNAETLKGKDGAPGTDGRDGINGIDGETPSTEVVLGLVKEVVSENADILKGKDGAPGQNGTDGRDADPVSRDELRELVREVIVEQKDFFVSMIREAILEHKDVLKGDSGRDGKDGAPGADGERGTDGAPGIDGKDAVIDPELITETVKSIIAADPPAPGRDGKEGRKGDVGEPGRDGRDGLPGTPGDPGRDGKDGKPGQDGLGIDDLELEKIDDRNLVLRFVNGEKKKEFPVKIAGMVFRDVYRREAIYEKGDLTLKDGSLWYCLVDKSQDQVPGGSDDWRLVAKRGADGKQGPRGGPAPSGVKLS